MQLLLQNRCGMTTTQAQRRIDDIIEHKCQQMGRCSSSSKSSAVHLEQWMKGRLGNPQCELAEEEEHECCEVWTEEMLRKRTEELHLTSRALESRCEELLVSEHTPSKSTTPESQVSAGTSEDSECARQHVQMAVVLYFSRNEYRRVETVFQVMKMGTFDK